MRRIVMVLGGLLAAAAAMAQPKPEAILRKEAGNDYLKRREYAKARDEYLAALKVDPTYEDAHYNLGVVYFFRLQDYPKALYHLTTYARLAREAPDMGQVKSLVTQALEKIEEPEREAYAKALAEGTAASIRAFLEKYPGSTYAADAKSKLRLVEGYEEEVRQQARAVEAEFADAVSKGTLEALDAFLAANPGAPQTAEALERRKRLASEEGALKAALAAGTVAALERFTAEHPEGPYAAQARAKITELKIQAERAAKSEAEARASVAEARARDAEARAREAEAAARAAADAAWSAAERANTPVAYELFTTAYPDDARAAAAKEKAVALRAADARSPVPPPAPAPPEAPATPAPVAAPATEPASRAPLTDEAKLGEDWAKAKATDTIEGYKAFLERHPRGEEADAARKRIEEISSPTFEGGGRQKSLDKYRRMIQGK